MKGKIITLLLAVALIVTFALPTASAAGLPNCNSVLNELNTKDFNTEVLNGMLEGQDCDANTALANVANMDELKETLQNQLKVKLDENCTNEDVMKALENCNLDANQLNPEMLKDLVKNEKVDLSKADVSNCATTSTNKTTEVPPEKNDVTTVKNDSDEMCLTVPTVKATPDAEPIPTDAPVAPTPIPTEVPVVEVTPVSTSDTASTPEPTVEATPVPSAKPTPVKTAEPTPVPTVEPTPKATTQPTDDNVTGVSSIEQKMVAMVNEDRAAAGLPALKIDTGLTKYARLHSQDMSANNFFSHTSPSNGSFSERLRNSNLGFMGAGENIALYGSVEKAQAGLMASDGHRANILGNYTHVGIGIVYNEAKGAYYITQWFGRK